MEENIPWSFVNYQKADGERGREIEARQMLALKPVIEQLHTLGACIRENALSCGGGGGGGSQGENDGS